MTLTEKFIADTIQLDSGAEVMYGSDQIYDTYPCRFPTVEFQLTARKNSTTSLRSVCAGKSSWACRPFSIRSTLS